MFLIGTLSSLSVDINVDSICLVAVLNFRFLFNFSLNFTLRNQTLEEKFWFSFTGLARSSRDNGQGIEAGGMFDSSYFNYCFMLISTLFGVKFDYYEHNICRT